jgi:transposase-like protein
MEKQTRRKFSAAFKAKVALEAVKNQQTLAQLAKKYELSPVVISKWKGEFLENLSATFERSDSSESQQQDTEKLYAAIGQLKVENEFLKKSCKKLGIQV